jgi:hypothetical protein
MSFMRRSFLLTAVVLLLSATEIFAGGFKRNSSVRVTNVSGQMVLVYYDDTNTAILNAIANDMTSAQFMADFTAAGGVVINNGDTHTFHSVKAGSYTMLAFDQAQVSAAFTANGTISPDVLDATLSITVDAGHTTKVLVVPSSTTPQTPVVTTAPDIMLVVAP